MQQERRQYTRVKTPILIEFPGEDGKERSFTYDVSESGLRFPTALELHVGQELDMHLELPPQRRCRVTAKIVWIREMAKIGATQYDVGVRFLWIEDPDRQQLRRHLQSVLRTV